MQQESSPITDLFQGQLVNRIHCESCGHDSLAFDNFQDLSVQIERSAVKMTGYTSVESLMKNFVKGEIMDRNGYKCSGCKKEARFLKDMSVYRFPKILVLHLKRFYNSYSRREKISSNIKIPE